MPQPTETALMEQIERLVVPPGQLALWGLGQAGFILKGGPTIVCIDPYLSDSITEIEGPKRRVPLPFAPGALRAADLVFATHEHLDHADAQTLGPLMAASVGARLITSLQGRDVSLKMCPRLSRNFSSRCLTRCRSSRASFIVFKYKKITDGHLLATLLFGLICCYPDCLYLLIKNFILY